MIIYTVLEVLRAEQVSESLAYVIIRLWERVVSVVHLLI